MELSFLPEEGVLNRETSSVWHIGTAGWSYPDWKGIVYPPSGVRGNQNLAALSRLVDAVEINVTFYRPVSPGMVHSWLKAVVPRPAFKFTAKAPSLLTHTRSAVPDKKVACTFSDSMRPLRESGKLGALLFQFPWSFKRTRENRSYLSQLLDLFEELPLCVEVRHSSWDHPDFFRGLSERKVAFCNIDQPLLDACIAPSARVTADFGYVRLHGRNTAQWFDGTAGRDGRYNYLYTQEELAEWVERILVLGKKVNDLYVITNNHYRGQSVVNALEIQQALDLPARPVPETLRFLYMRP